MQRFSLGFLAFALVVGSVQFVGTRVASADAMAAATMAPIDCAKADSMMHDAMMSMPSPSAMTGSMDKKFTDMMLEQTKANMKVANVEAQCGKSQKVRDWAKAAMVQLEAEARQLQSVAAGGY